MKITIDERPEASGIEVAIVCRRTDQQVLDIVARLRMFDRKVTGSADGGTRCGSTRWRSAWRDATSCGWPRAAW